MNEELIKRIDAYVYKDYDEVLWRLLEDCRAALTKSSSEVYSRYVQMSFNDYQEWTRTTAIYPVQEYPMLGIAEEVGELLGKIAKYYRDGGQMPYEAITKEAGDVLWMLSRILDDLGITLEEAAGANVEKLESRKQRNVISGSGDDR